MHRTSLGLAAALMFAASGAKAQAPEQLSRIQLIALQQQMRDDGCAVKHVTVQWDAPTRQGLLCEQRRLGINGGPLQVLYAMNIGFRPGDTPPVYGLIPVSPIPTSIVGNTSTMPAGTQSVSSNTERELNVMVLGPASGIPVMSVAGSSAMMSCPETMPLAFSTDEVR